ncbi:MAG TPA: hypothetical protein DEO62_03095 [Lachnospiraceae bacterium]|nr:hypothetical protein [Lachnospiraceae bacterium]
MQEFWVELDRLVRGNDLLDALYEFVNGVDFKAFFGNNSLYVDIAVIIFMILSFINCLFGYKLKRAWSTMECALAGGITALYVVDEFWPMSKYLYTVLIACTAAVICAILGYIIVRFEMAVRAGVYSGFLFTAIFLSLKLDTLSIILGLAVGFIVAIVTAIMPRAMGIIYTAASGAIGVGASLAMFIFALRVYNYLTYIGIGALTLIGIIIQGVSLHISKRRVPVYDDEEKAEAGMQHVSAGDNIDNITEENSEEAAADVSEDASAEPSVTEEIKPESMTEPSVTEEAPESMTEPSVTEEVKPESMTEPSVTEEVKPESITEPSVTEEVKPESMTEPSVTEEVKPESMTEPSVTEEVKKEPAAEQPIVIVDEVAGNSSDNK